MGTLLEQILDAAHRGPSVLTPFLSEHRRELTPDLALQAREIYKQALNGQHWQQAMDAILACTFVYLHLGNRYEALLNYLDYYQLLFMAADTTEQYQIAYKSVQEIAVRAREIGSTDLVFQSAVLAADTAYFASKSQGDSIAVGPEWIMAALNNLLTASEFAPQQKDSSWFQRYVSIVGATVGYITARPWVEDQVPDPSSDTAEAGFVDFSPRLRSLASAVETSVPLDFEFPDPARTHSITGELAQLSYDFGNPKIADARLSAAMERAAWAGNIERWIESAMQRYKGARGLGEPLLVQHLRDALLDRSDQFRQRFRSRAGRLWTAQQLDSVFGTFLTDEFHQTTSASELFSIIEMGKARTLLDLMAGAFKDFPTANGADQAAEIERQILRFEPGKPDDLVFSQLRLTSQLSIGFPQFESFEGEHDPRSELLTAAESLYVEHHAGFQGVQSIAELSQLLQALEPDEALIAYCYPYQISRPGADLFALVITSEQTRIIRIAYEGSPLGFEGRISTDKAEFIDFSVLGSEVTTARVAIHGLNEGNALDSLGELYRVLISPLLQNGIKPQDFKRWIIVPHGVLHYIPFAALIDSEGRYLIQDVAVSVVPSASVWLNLRQRQPRAVTSFLGLANPALPGVAALPEAEQELDSILQSLHSLQITAYKGKEATESRLRNEAQGKGIIHFATHGNFPERDMIDFHQILLSPTAEHDGRLTAEELRHMDLSSARLIVLSICNGSIYRFGPGDEPYGLISALLTAGAENILGTLWPIEDRVGRAFMAEFYKSLLSHGPAEALRQTCIQSIQDLKVLRDWAGFTLIGPGRPFS